MTMTYAEDVNYWQSSTTSPDTWLGKAKTEILRAGGRPGAELFGNDGQGRSAYMLEFELAGERYRAVWPVLPSKTRNERAARIQAATMLYHDIKARCVAAKVLGGRAAFLTYLLLPDGRTAADASTPELAERWPKLLPPPPREETSRE
jgi:hypothetical protein